MRQGLVVGLFFILVYLPSALSAQEQPTSPTSPDPKQETTESTTPPKFTDVLVVSASRAQEELANAPAAVTVIEKGGKDAIAWPSDTLMTMFEYVPTWEVVGVPDTAPFSAPIVAHAGSPVALKDRTLPSASTSQTPVLFSSSMTRAR